MMEMQVRKPCGIAGCERAVLSRARYCPMHEYRMKRYGSSELPPPPATVLRGTKPDAARVRELFDYDPLSGGFVRKPQPLRSGCKPALTGTDPSKRTAQGYLSIVVEGRHYPAHRIAWLHHYGAWPEKFIDHINGDRADNRIANLRDVSAKVNNENRHRPRRGTRSGILGVNAYPDGTFTSSIKYDGKQHYLGTFGTAEEARAVYLAAKAKHHPAAATGK